jgi:hypothetical protein
MIAFQSQPPLPSGSGGINFLVCVHENGKRKRYRHKGKDLPKSGSIGHQPARDLRSFASRAATVQPSAIKRFRDQSQTGRAIEGGDSAFFTINLAAHDYYPGHHFVWIDFSVRLRARHNELVCPRSSEQLEEDHYLDYIRSRCWSCCFSPSLTVACAPDFPTDTYL